MPKLSQDILRSNMDMAKQAKESMASWVKELGLWRLFVTLTMAPPSQSTGLGVTGSYDRRGYGAIRRAWGRFLELAETEVGAPVSYFFVIEEHESGVPHIHALVGPKRDGSADFDSRDLSELARRLQNEASRDIGFSRVKPLDPDKGAEQYVCKYCVKGDTLWEYRE